MAVAVPFLVVIVTGCLLQVKRWLPTLQPTSSRSVVGGLDRIGEPVAWDAILAAAQSVPQAGVQRWRDIKMIDIRPVLGVARVRTAHGYEVQIDLASGRVLSAGPRLASTILEMHEGTFFGEFARNGVFLPAALGVLAVTLTGVWLGLQHFFYLGRRKWTKTPFGSGWKRNTSSWSRNQVERSGITT